MTKNLIFGVLLPGVLVICGIALAVFLQVPVPKTQRPANPENEAELLEFLTAAEVQVVRPLAEPLAIEATGTVVPYRELQLAAEVAGRIVEKAPNVRSGNFVAKGQLLYRINPQDYELALERLTRRKLQEEASIKELEQDIENTRDLLEVAKEQFALAEAEVGRFEKMSANFSSAAELDTARQSRLASMNQKVTLQNQLRSQQSRQTRIELAAKLVETEIAQAKLDLGRTEITAPVDGLIVSEQVEVDSFVQRGAQLMVLEDTEKVEVACNIRMEQLSWILEQPGVSTDQLVTATQTPAYDLPEAPVEVGFKIAGRETQTFVWQGVLDRFEGGGIDPQSRTVPIRIQVDNPDQVFSETGEAVTANGHPNLVRGLFVDVKIKTQPATALLLVPKLSIKPATGTSVIWKFQEDRAALRTTPQALEAIALYEEAKEAGTVEEVYALEEGEEAVVDDLDSWLVGNLEVVDGVRIVSAYWDNEDIEYWVCEVPGGMLGPGDKVIVTPLPGIRADGTDGVRVAKASTRAETDDGQQGIGDAAASEEGDLAGEEFGRSQSENEPS
ncbi:MAG: efflux RND transporter periplasmic adaptor subunit [Pirellulaceae bacterium]